MLGKRFCLNGHDTKLTGRYKNRHCKQCVKDAKRQSHGPEAPQRAFKGLLFGGSHGLVSSFDFETGPGFTSERLGDYYVVEEEMHLLDEVEPWNRVGRSVFGTGWPDNEGIIFLKAHLAKEPNDRRPFIIGPRKGTDSDTTS